MFVENVTPRPDRPLSRRNFLKALGAAAVAGPLSAAFATSSAQAASANASDAAAPTRPEPADPITIQWWSDKTDAASVDSVTRYLVEPFNQANSDIKLEFVSLPNYYGGVLDTAVASGKVGDIYTHNGPAWIGRYADSGWAADLAPFDQTYGWSKQYWPWIWEQGKYKGVNRLIPGEFEMLALYYNRKVFAANDWRPPQTFEDTLSFGKTLAEKNLIGYAAGKDTGNYEWWLCYACHAWAGSHATWEGLAGKRPWTDELFVESFQKTADLWQAGLMSDKQSMSISIPDARGLFARERAMLLLEGTWTLRSIAQWAPNLDWDFVPAPVWRPDARKAIAVGNGEIFVLNPQSPNLDATGKVANALFFGDRKQVLTWAGKPGVPGTVIPPMFYEEADFPADFPDAYKRQILAIVEAARNQDFGFLAWCSWPQKTETYMYTELPNVWLGQLSAKEYLANAQRIFAEEFAAGGVNPGPEPRR